jgi:hypothetical protein
LTRESVGLAVRPEYGAPLGNHPLFTAMPTNQKDCKMAFADGKLSIGARQPFLDRIG